MTRGGAAGQFQCQMCARVQWLDCVLPARANFPEGWEETFCPEESRCYYWRPDLMETSWSRPGARRYDGVLLQSPCRCSLIPRAVTMPVDRLHVEPFWEAVLRMNKLTCPTFHLLDQNGCPDSAAPFSMLRFQTRNMAKLDLGSAQVRGMYQVFGVCDSVEDHERLRIPPEASGCFTMYHFTDIGNLLSGCPSGHPSLPLTGQDGILRDGGLRFGTFHGDGIGVYIFSHRALWNLSWHGQVVMLEVLCLPFLKHLNRGAKGRYVCKAPAQGPFACGAPCRAVQIEAIWMKQDHVPEFMQHFHMRHEVD